MNSILERQVTFFNIFKETAANNIGLIHGFANWTNKMSFTIQGDDLLIKIPPVLVRNGGYAKISRSKRRKEADDFMKRKEYTYLEYVIKMTCTVYATLEGKQLAQFNGFYRKGKKKNGKNNIRN